MNRPFYPPSNNNDFDKTNPFKKPDNVSEQDWNLYMYAIVASFCKMPVGMKVYDAYIRVENVLNPPKTTKRTRSDYKNFKSCVNE